MTGRPQPPEPPQHWHGQNGKVGQIRAPVNQLAFHVCHTGLRLCCRNNGQNYQVLFCFVLKIQTLFYGNGWKHWKMSISHCQRKRKKQTWNWSFVWIHIIIVWLRFLAYATVFAESHSAVFVLSCRHTNKQKALKTKRPVEEDFRIN